MPERRQASSTPVSYTHLATWAWFVRIVRSYSVQEMGKDYILAARILSLIHILNISDTQLSYITNVDAGHGLIKVGSSLVPFANKFPKHTKLYKLMTTKPGEGA